MPYGSATSWEHWDRVLLATVDRLGLTDLDKPGWYFLPSES